MSNERFTSSIMRRARALNFQEREPGRTLLAFMKKFNRPDAEGGGYSAVLAFIKSGDESIPTNSLLQSVVNTAERDSEESFDRIAFIEKFSEGIAQLEKSVLFIPRAAAKGRSDSPITVFYPVDPFDCLSYPALEDDKTPSAS